VTLKTLDEDITKAEDIIPKGNNFWQRSSILRVKFQARQALFLTILYIFRI
jgi:hypothetical protein